MWQQSNQNPSLYVLPGVDNWCATISVAKDQTCCWSVGNAIEQQYTTFGVAGDLQSAKSQAEDALQRLRPDGRNADLRGAKQQAIRDERAAVAKRLHELFGSGLATSSTLTTLQVRVWPYIDANPSLMVGRSVDEVLQAV